MGDETTAKAWQQRKVQKKKKGLRTERERERKLLDQESRSSGYTKHTPGWLQKKKKKEVGNNKRARARLNKVNTTSYLPVGRKRKAAFHSNKAKLHETRGKNIEKINKSAYYVPRDVRKKKYNVCEKRSSMKGMNRMCCAKKETKAIKPNKQKEREREGGR